MRPRRAPGVETAARIRREESKLGERKERKKMKPREATRDPSAAQITSINFACLESMCVCHPRVRQFPLWPHGGCSV